MFYDLNVRVPTALNVDSYLEPIVERLFKYGYRGIAVTIEVDESFFIRKKDKESNKESKKKNPGNVDPNNFLPSPPDLTVIKAKFPKIFFYKRINITVNETSNIRKFTQCKNLKKFNLISFETENQNVLKMLTSIAEVDIISYNPENKNKLTLNRKLYNQFVNQNVYFELVYSPAIIDSTARRNLLSLSHTFRAVGKSKNIIVSSGAQSAPYIRGPYDVINFNLLFGLSEEQAKSSISRMCEKLLLRARKQRQNKTTIEMVQKESPSETVMALSLQEADQDD